MQPSPHDLDPSTVWAVPPPPTTEILIRHGHAAAPANASVTIHSVREIGAPGIQHAVRVADAMAADPSRWPRWIAQQCTLTPAGCLQFTAGGATDILPGDWWLVRDVRGKVHTLPDSQFHGNFEPAAR